MIRHLCLALYSFFFLCSCISVKLPLSSPGKDDRVTFKKPTSPFQQTPTDFSDQLWISEATGNSISFKSECGTKSLSLEGVSSEALSALKDLQVIEKNKTKWKGNDAIEVLATGKVDTSLVKIHLLSVVKSGCFYLVSFGGLEPNFKKEENHYVEFKQHFLVP